MLNEQAIDLINRSMDGVLSESEQAEFELLLADSEEARQYNAELNALGTLLGGLPAVEPPQALEGRLIRQIPLPQRRPWFTLSAGWMQGKAIPYGVAAATGVLATVAFYQFNPQPGGISDYSSLVGTLARGRGIEDPVHLSFLDIDIPAVNGKVLLSGSGELKLLRFDVDSQDPVEFEVGLGGSGLTFGGFAEESGATSDGIDYADGRFTISNTGAHRFTVILRDSEAQRGPSGGVVVSVTQAGESLYQGVLSP